MKHLISVLGTTKYDEVKYKLNEKAETSKFIQLALAKLLFDDCNNVRCTVFVTEKAKIANWEELSNQMRSNGIPLDGMNGELSEIEIPTGKDETELWQIFGKIFDCINENDELYIDITQSLRDIPIQMLAVAMYARVVKNVTVSGIYYGAFESMNENGEVPVFDLSCFLDVMDLSYAAEDFLHFGNSGKFKNVFDGKKVKEERDKYYNYTGLIRSVSALNDFTNCISCGRGKKGTKSTKEKGAKEMSIYSAWEEYSAGMGELKRNKSEKYDFLRPVVGMLEVAEEKISEYGFNKDMTNFDVGLSTAKWAIDYDNIQLGFTALEETVKTWLCIINGISEENKDDREKIKFYYLALWNNREIKKQVSNELSDLTELIKNISDDRNTMNHFGFSNVQTYKKLKEHLKKYYGKFIVFVEKAKDNNQQYIIVDNIKGQLEEKRK